MTCAIRFKVNSIVCLCRYRLGEILASGGRNGRRTASGTALERHIRFGTFTSSSIVIFIAIIFTLYYTINEMLDDCSAGGPWLVADMQRQLSLFELQPSFRREVEHGTNGTA